MPPPQAPGSDRPRKRTPCAPCICPDRRPSFARERLYPASKILAACVTLERLEKEYRRARLLDELGNGLGRERRENQTTVLLLWKAIEVALRWGHEIPRFAEPYLAAAARGLRKARTNEEKLSAIKMLEPGGGSSNGRLYDHARLRDRALSLVHEVKQSNKRLSWAEICRRVWGGKELADFCEDEGLKPPSPETIEKWRCLESRP